MSVIISRKLNLVLPPVETKEGTAYVYSVPISRAVFESCFGPMARAMSAIITQGYGPITGPSVASLILKREARAINELSVVEGTLLPEIKRLTHLGFVGKGEGLPYSVAIQRGLLDEDQQLEVENILCYFTLASWIRLPEELSAGMGLDGLRQLWQVATTSLTLTDYMRSLQTSTPDESTGEKVQTKPKAAPASSIAA